MLNQHLTSYKFSINTSHKATPPITWFMVITVLDAIYEDVTSSNLDIYLQAQTVLASAKASCNHETKI